MPWVDLKRNKKRSTEMKHCFNQVNNILKVFLRQDREDKGYVFKPERNKDF